jgi:hypothetical protein
VKVNVSPVPVNSIPAVGSDEKLSETAEAEANPAHATNADTATARRELLKRIFIRRDVDVISRSS